MANNYIPFDLKIASVISKTAIITWDVSNVIEFKAGTKYKLYGSLDGANYEYLQTAARTEDTVDITKAKYIRITSHTPILGESSKSAPLLIPDVIKDPVPVATGPDGDVAILKTTEDNRLEVSLQGDSLGFAAQTDALNAIKDLVATESTQSAALEALNSIVANTAVAYSHAGDLRISEAELVALRVDPCMSISTDDAARLIIYGKN